MTIQVFINEQARTSSRFALPSPVLSTILGPCQIVDGDNERKEKELTPCFSISQSPLRLAFSANSSGVSGTGIFGSEVLSVPSRGLYSFVLKAILFITLPVWYPIYFLRESCKSVENYQSLLSKGNVLQTVDTIGFSAEHVYASERKLWESVCRLHQAGVTAGVVQAEVRQAGPGQQSQWNKMAVEKQGIMNEQLRQLVRFSEVLLENVDCPDVYAVGDLRHRLWYAERFHRECELVLLELSCELPYVFRLHEGSAVALQLDDVYVGKLQQALVKIGKAIVHVQKLMEEQEQPLFLTEDWLGSEAQVFYMGNESVEEAAGKWNQCRLTLEKILDNAPQSELEVPPDYTLAEEEFGTELSLISRRESSAISSLVT